MQTIAQEVFASERPVPIDGYLMSTCLSLSRYPHVPRAPLTPEELETSVTPALDAIYSDVSALGPFERALLYLATSPSNTVLAVVGSSGSGKTATMKFLERWTTAHALGLRDFPSAIYIDCNNFPPPAGQSVDEQRRHLHQALALALLQVLEAAAQILHSFLSRDDDLTGLRDSPFVFDLLRRLRPVALRDGTSTQALIDTLWQNLAEYDPINRWRSLLGIIGQLWCSRGKPPLFFCIDNIDPIDPALQSEVLESVLCATNSSQLPVVVPMRIISYHRANSQQFSLATLGHSGLTPLQVCVRRAEWALSEPHLGRWRPRSLAAFACRLAENAGVLFGAGKHHSLARSLCGRGVRRGLDFARRLFEPHASIVALERILNDSDVAEILRLLRSDGHDPLPDRLRRVEDYAQKLRFQRFGQTVGPHLWIQTNLEKGLDQRGISPPLVENLFHLDGATCQTAAKIRILQILREDLANDRSLDCTVGSVARRLRGEGFDEWEIARSFASLHLPGRRLIWCAWRNDLGESGSLDGGEHAPCGITATGLGYLEHVLISVDYAGVALARTPADRITASDKSLSVRATFAARLMYEEVLAELHWIKRAIHGKTRANPDSVRPAVISVVLEPLLDQSFESLCSHGVRLAAAASRDRQFLVEQLAILDELEGVRLNLRGEIASGIGAAPLGRTAARPWIQLIKSLRSTTEQ